MRGKGSGQTALHWAAESGQNSAIVALLSSSPLLACALDERGASPRDLALRELRFSSASLLEGAERTEYFALTLSLEPTGRAGGDDRAPESALAVSAAAAS